MSKLSADDPSGEPAKPRGFGNFENIRHFSFLPIRESFLRFVPFFSFLFRKNCLSNFLRGLFRWLSNASPKVEKTFLFVLTLLSLPINNHRLKHAYHQDTLLRCVSRFPPLHFSPRFISRLQPKKVSISRINSTRGNPQKKIRSTTHFISPKTLLKWEEACSARGWTNETQRLEISNINGR